MIDLSQLPAPDVIETLDFEALLAERKARLLALTPESDREALANVLALESDPITKLIEENCYEVMTLRQRVNDACHAVMLAYALGSDLDQLAAHWNVQRLLVDAGQPEAVPPIPPTYESDTRLRYRTQLAMESLTVAGSRGSYMFHAMTATPRVQDVSVIGPELTWENNVATSSNGVPPGMVMVYLLDTENDGVPDESLLAVVSDYLSAETRRPLCDTVTVEPAEIVEYTIEASLFIYPGPSEAPVLAKAQADVEAFAAENFKLGYDVRLSALYAKLHVGGVQRVELDEPPADIVIEPHQAARCTAVTITLGGRDV